MKSSTCCDAIVVNDRCSDCKEYNEGYCTHENTIDVGDAEHTELVCTGCGKHQNEIEEQLNSSIKFLWITHTATTATPKYQRYKALELCLSM